MITMDSLFKTIGSGDHGHPSEDELLLYVDGELAPKASTRLRAHLEACWSCRVRTEKIEDAISTFIDYRNQVLKPLVEPPPHDWRGFDGRLRGLASQVGKPSIFANFRGTLGRIFAAPNLSINFRVLMRPVAATLIVALLAAVLIRFNRTSIVSASEMLQRVAAAQQSEIAATSQAVVYQKLQVRRKVVASSAAETVTWEVWSDTVNSRARQSIEDATGRHFLHLDMKDARSDQTSMAKISPQQDSPGSLIELNAVLRSNHMNPSMPLSASSYETWRRSVEPKHEEVTKTTTSDGHQALTLRTAATGEIAQGAIIEASLIVRENDWHPIEERLRVKSDRGDEEFELVETAYSVVSLNTLSPTIFNDQPVVASSPGSSPELQTRNSKLETVNPALAPLPPAASADLEVEVLGLLNQAGADLGEQVSATRSGDRLLHVAGIVESPQRKAEILRALEPVVNNSAVRIEIQTVAEAVAEQQQQRSRANATPGPISEQKVEINSEAIAAAPELRRHFSSDEEIRQFAARIVSQSRSAMRHVYAMKRLLGQFSPEELRTLTPEAKGKWLALIRSHARAYQSDAEGLRRELQPIFFPSAGGTAPGRGPEITDDSSLAQAVNQLFELASANDGVIRAAFATTSETVATSAISSPQFSQSLSNAEGLAARIGNSR
jgi:anti-sigma factor RsiW